MRAHVIENGKVVNTIEVESLDVFTNLIDASAGGQIGDDYDAQAGTFSAPAIPPVVPKSVSRAQGLIALDDFGYTDALNAIRADPATPKRMLIALDNAQDFERDSESLVALAAALGLTDEQVGQLFIYAYGIRP